MGDNMKYMYTLPLDAIDSSLATTGGKGNNLGILSRGSKNSSNNNNSKGGRGGSIDISVPAGFTVTVAAYRDFCAENKLHETIQEALLRFGEENNHESATTANKLEQVSLQIRNAFRQAKVNKTLWLEIKSRLENLLVILLPGGDVTYLAIRSSATCEDMPEASFAGQHDTFLNVAYKHNSNDNNNSNSGVDHVCAHVVDCFGSLFTSRAIAYRQRNGISHLHAGMAVVVQELVPCVHSSGVLFTANPLTGRRNETVIEAIPGLGEALVSGLTEPDRYIITRRRTSTSITSNNNNNNNSDKEALFRIKDMRVGAKRTAIRPVPGGGVVQEEETAFTVVADNDEQKQQQGSTTPTTTMTTILSNDDVMELVELGQKIEALFDGIPQDVEWAKSSNGKTFVVQSRPITTLFPCPKVPKATAATAAGNASSRPLQVYISFGAVQGFATPWFPAGQQAVFNVLGGLVRYMTWGRKGKRSSDGGDFLQVVAERIYANATPVLHNSLGRKLYGKALAAVEPSILRGVQELLPNIKVDSGGMSLFMLLRIASIMSIVLPRFLYSFLFPEHSRKGFIHVMKEKVASIQRQADTATSLAQLVQIKEKSLEGFFPFVIFRFLPRMAAGMGPLYLLSRLAVSSSIPNDKDLVLTITRGLPHNVTTEMDLKLWEVAKIIRSNNEAFQFIRNNNADALALEYKRGKLPRVAQHAIGSFLDVYGMRGLYEIDFGRPRWREEPAPLFQTIKSYIEIDSEQENAAPDRVFAKGEAAAEKAIAELGRALAKPWLVRFLAHRTRTIAGVRELPKFTIIRIMGIFRQKYLEQGEKLVRAGTLDSPRDIFFLCDDELKSIDIVGGVGGGGDSANQDYWKTIVAQRKAVMDKENGRTAIPRVIASDGFAFYGGAFASKNANAGDGGDDDGNAFVGEPVSPGSVEGIVHIVHDPSKSSLKAGEILVCHGTDPSWTPLFLAARGLVMEVGGLMTHGSVVAREYGIPAVVGLEKITERLENGQRIRVDGSSGIVSILLDEQQKKKEEEEE